jgi:hypothetical protein
MKHSPIWWIGQYLLVINDENLPIINKTKHLTKGEKKVQDERMQVMAEEKSSKKGRLLEKWEQIKYLNLLLSWKTYHTMKGKEHIKEHLKEPSLIIITCFKIEATYGCCNTTNTFYL